MLREENNCVARNNARYPICQLFNPFSCFSFFLFPYGAGDEYAPEYARCSFIVRTASNFRILLTETNYALLCGSSFCHAVAPTMVVVVTGTLLMLIVPIAVINL